jgi:hypothetical protein
MRQSNTAQRSGFDVCLTNSMYLPPFVLWSPKKPDATVFHRNELGAVVRNIPERLRVQLQGEMGRCQCAQEVRGVEGLARRPITR